MTSSTPGIIDFATQVGTLERSEPPPDRLITGHPVQGVRNLFGDSSGQFFAGFWESSSGKWRVRYTENELCHLLAGVICITAESGASWIFSPGASFVVPAGFVGTWEVIEPARKLYAIFEART